METNHLPNLKADFIDKAALYQAYMPFIQHGAIFIKTNTIYQIGDTLLISLKLLDEIEEHRFFGNVIWVTPANAQHNRPNGIGIQFLDEKGKIVRNQIETYLAGMLKMRLPTHTL